MAMASLILEVINTGHRLSQPCSVPFHAPNLRSFTRVTTPSACTFVLPLRKLKERRKHLSRSSSEGVPTELIEEEDSKFVPLNADDAQFGPPALLLLGFGLDEAEKVKELLKEMGGEFLQIIYGTEDMISGSLWDAVNTEQQNYEKLKIAKSVPRICFMSGLSGEEMMMFIDAFPETGLEPAVFAALVPNSADKPVHELIEEIMGDHEMLSARQIPEDQAQ